MAFSMSNVLNSLVEATTRSPKAITLPDQEDLYEKRHFHRPGMDEMMSNAPARPMSAADVGKSSEELEHDTLSRIRDALYRDQQS